RGGPPSLNQPIDSPRRFGVDLARAGRPFCAAARPVTDDLDGGRAGDSAGGQMRDSGRLPARCTWPVRGEVIEAGIPGRRRRTDILRMQDRRRLWPRLPGDVYLAQR